MIRYGKTEVKKIAALLDQNWDSAEEAADALLKEALAILEERGKWTVVGQLAYSMPLGGYVDRKDADASKVCLGMFSSKAEAERAADSLVFSPDRQETFRSWVLDVEHCTPREVYQKRKEFHRQREIEAREEEVRQWKEKLR